MTQHQRKTNRPLSPTTAYLESRSTASIIGVMTSLRSHVILLAVLTRFPLFMWMSFKLTFFWDKLEYFSKSFTKTVLCDCIACHARSYLSSMYRRWSIFSCWCSSPLLQGQDAQKDLSKFNASAKEKDLRTKIKNCLFCAFESVLTF